MGNCLSKLWSSRLFVAFVLAFALVMQPNTMAFAKVAQLAAQADVMASHDSHHRHDIHEAADTQTKHCSDPGSVAHCGVLGCGGMNCDTAALVLANAHLYRHAEITLDALATAAKTGSSFEPPEQPPRF